MRPQEAHFWLVEVDGNDDELPCWADFDDGFCFFAFEREAPDNAFDFARLAVALALDDLARENDAFEVEDREIVIVKLFCGVDGDDIFKCANKVAD